MIRTTEMRRAIRAIGALVKWEKGIVAGRREKSAWSDSVYGLHTFLFSVSAVSARDSAASIF